MIYLTFVLDLNNIGQSFLSIFQQSTLSKSAGPQTKPCLGQISQIRSFLKISLTCTFKVRHIFAEIVVQNNTASFFLFTHSVGGGGRVGWVFLGLLDPLFVRIKKKTLFLYYWDF
jgi:hypothetical protein